MPTRRSFLARSSALLAGAAGIPAFAKASADDRSDVARLGLERAFLNFELHTFANEYLPILLAPLRLVSEGTSQRLVLEEEKLPESDRMLKRWQAAARQLKHFVAHDYRCERWPMPVDEWRQLFAESAQACPFMLGPYGGPAFRRGRARFFWNIHPYYIMEAFNIPYVEEVLSLSAAGGSSGTNATNSLSCGLADMNAGFAQLPPLVEKCLDCMGRAFSTSYVEQVLTVRGEATRKLTNLMNRLRRHLPQVKAWFHQLPFEDKCFHAKFLLPILAEYNPKFVVDVLDRNYWRASLAAERRIDPLTDLDVEKPCFSGFLSNLVTQVIETLANNHFLTIGRLLEYPEIHADPWDKGFMSQLIFAVQYHKAVALREPIC